MKRSKKIKMPKKRTRRPKKIPKKKSPAKIKTLNWSEEAVMVTGGASLLGAGVVKKLREDICGCRKIIIPDSRDYNNPISADDFIELHMPSMIIHTDMDVDVDMLIEISRKYSVQKFVSIGMCPANAKIINITGPYASDIIRAIEQHDKYLMAIIIGR